VRERSAGLRHGQEAPLRARARFGGARHSWRRARLTARGHLRAGLSLRSQELTALFLAVRLFCRCVRSPDQLSLLQLRQLK